MVVFQNCKVGRPGEQTSHVVKTMRTGVQCSLRIGDVLNGMAFSGGARR